MLIPDGPVVIHHGDCLERLRLIGDNRVDAIVTDPPAGIAFMGKAWDADRGGRDQWVAWLADVLRECHRVLKPGGHALVWALPRTSHWTATALEDAGFEIRDRIAHWFGSGFPKSHNLSGAWDGWGTALKPACEDWWLARKPLSEPTVAANVLRWGTGAINVDGCRIVASPKDPNVRNSATHQEDAEPGFSGGWGLHKRTSPHQHGGRWPANVILSHSLFCTADACDPFCPVALLDAQSGERRSGGYPRAGTRRTHVSTYGEPSERGAQRFGSSVGSASRFYYVAKASRAERNAGLEGLPERTATRYGEMGQGPLAQQTPHVHRPERNHHPTVKPLALMQWLIRLVTPPGGVVLDPFAGSGTTGVAAVTEGMRCILIEQEAEYVDIIRRRVEHALVTREAA